MGKGKEGPKGIKKIVGKCFGQSVRVCRVYIFGGAKGVVLWEKVRVGQRV